MATLKAIRKTNDRDPYLKGVQRLVSTTSVSIYELENLYTKTFNLDASPLIHCTTTQKGFVLTTIPGVKVRSVIDDRRL